MNSFLLKWQVYGAQKRKGESKAADIEFLLQKYPNFRVAYIDSRKAKVYDSEGIPSVVDEYYSVLIKAARMGEDSTKNIQEVYRVKLPGNPIVGEGKPENQNHAIIFTRGEYMQTIDMNQDNYFEEVRLVVVSSRSTGDNL